MSQVAVVGAGALGQPFGHHLHRGGADLTYVVKETYRDDLEEGLTLHEHRIFRDPAAHDLDDFEVCVSYDALADRDWDQVWLCVSSPAIRGDWVPELLEAVGDTTLVSIQPGLEDRDYLASLYPDDRIVSGRVSMIAYETPLPGEDLPEGDIAYFMPPGERIWWGGPTGRAREVATSLDEGGCPAGVRDDLREYALFSSALLETTVAGLELADWSLDGFKGSEYLGLATDAAREAIEVVAAKFGAKAPLAVRLGAKSPAMRLGLSVAPAVLPFDLEAYLREHFTKVGDQTRDELQTFIDTGREHGVDTLALSRLLKMLKKE